MSKFKRVLSDDDLLDVYRSLDNPKRDRDRVIEAMAAAVDAAISKLTEQEPVAYQSPITEHVDFLLASKKLESDWIPLYAHPCVTPTSDKTTCGVGNTKYATQHHLSYLKRYQKWRRGEDKTMDEAGLTPKKIGESLDWVIGVAEGRIPDAKKYLAAAPKCTEVKK